MRKKTITRRDFLKVAAITPFTGAFACGLKSPQQEEAARKAKVVLVRDKNALRSLHNPNFDVIQKMLDDAVSTLFGEKDPAKAWKKIVKPSDVVGIKNNVWRPVSTTKEVEQAIKQRVMDVGVPEENIGINDRGVRGHPVFQKATVLINARPMRTHAWSGVGSLIKNYITFAPNWSSYHGDSCADLASIWNDFNLKEKTKLNILVMLNPQFYNLGRHHYSDKYVWAYNGLLVGQDPVAIDTTGVRIIETKRREFFGRERPLQPSAKHIPLADTRHNLGVSDPNRIEIIKLGWKEEILI
ncbi:MAG: DUF362 domain-containing protein [Candidatus Aminicenantes bacterium]|nr:MAG: DUF362 domain-containing protein [Candidatus Aminicenantes bacterium]